MIKNGIIISTILLNLAVYAESSEFIKTPDVVRWSAANEGCLVSNPKNVELSLTTLRNRKARSGRFKTSRRYRKAKHRHHKTSNRYRRPKFLLADFVVTAPTPGYSFDMKVNRRKSNQRKVVLDLIVTPPSDMVIQMITESKVRHIFHSFPARPPGASVQVNCAGRRFFEVDNVFNKRNG